MPTYDYICQKCGHQFDLFQSITAKPLKKCPNCQKNQLKRLIGSGACIIFKGSGFYQNDYRNENYKKDSAKQTTKPPATTDKVDKPNNVDKTNKADKKEKKTA